MIYIMKWKIEKKVDIILENWEKDWINYVKPVLTPLTLLHLAIILAEHGEKLKKNIVQDIPGSNMRKNLEIMGIW